MSMYKIGGYRVIIDPYVTYIYSPSGKAMHVPHDEKPGDHKLAKELGYHSAEQMNREHDPLHVLVAHMLRLKESGPLSYGAGERPIDPLWKYEEGIVLAIQKYMVAADISIEEVLLPYKVNPHK